MEANILNAKVVLLSNDDIDISQVPGKGFYDFTKVIGNINVGDTIAIIPKKAVRNKFNKMDICGLCFRVSDLSTPLEYVFRLEIQRESCKFVTKQVVEAFLDLLDLNGSGWHCGFKYVKDNLT